MTITRFRRSLAALLASCTLCAGARAAEDPPWKAPRWRVELGGFQGVEYGYVERGDDFGVEFTVEYEFPVHEHISIGARAQPLFYYRDEVQQTDVWGAALGMAMRVYQVEKEQRGFFAELGASALGTSEYFASNGSHLNFVTQVGVGYRFRSSLHLSLQARHISNGGLDEANSGANALGLTLGFTF